VAQTPPGAWESSRSHETSSSAKPVHNEASGFVKDASGLADHAGNDSCLPSTVGADSKTSKASKTSNSEQETVKTSGGSAFEPATEELERESFGATAKKGSACIFFCHAAFVFQRGLASYSSFRCIGNYFAIYFGIAPCLLAAGLRRCIFICRNAHRSRSAAGPGAAGSDAVDGPSSSFRERRQHVAAVFGARAAVRGSYTQGRGLRSFTAEDQIRLRSGRHREAGRRYFGFLSGTLPKWTMQR